MANKLMVTTLIVLCRVDTDSKLVWFGEDRGVKRRASGASATMILVDVNTYIETNCNSTRC